MNETPNASSDSAARRQISLGIWIQIAIEHGAILTVSRSQWKFQAKLDWPLLDTDPIEEEGDTISEAIDLVNDTCQEDAANEMIEAGNV